MSRIGKKLIKIPEGTEVKIDDQVITITGSKGTLSRKIPSFIFCTFTEKAKTIKLDTLKGSEDWRSFHGLFRSLVSNMVIGVSTGFHKILELKGIGYRASLHGQDLLLSIGYSKNTQLKLPPNLSISILSPTLIKISGLEKSKVGDFSSKIRGLRPPEPYKGKGVMYVGEIFKRKLGKTSKK